ncbi:transcriptional activator of acetoin/glycerol metabolism [Desulfosporosinus orientis DSM 765]|uniref:Transcriptional activator of acetoin/glycerol metabolism n=1 Tax=Desulfosporosinus orientis (strain ATCC 19365 / DSM 765 / NCIMB 8382 / VKM B-1628 / Singapore I) TaxID=768706 RepID=G7WCG0_DESOD|nr:sigma-54-dependent Fis family transcriptional regulator [Desulfosporosinus orientis]AET66282.1 transcriptional activator of acetoin/glycerol metabolism [Desulfosporosinus orientis DSM 765]
MSWQSARFSPRGLVKHRKLLKDFWYKFINHSPDPLNIQSAVYDSWIRCQNFKIDPHRIRTEDLLNDEDIKDMISGSKLYKYAITTLNQLFVQAEKTRYLITLSDSLGRIIYLDGDRQIKKQAEKINFVLGSSWSEESIGTNAIGTSLKTGHPVQIFAAEHFCEGIHEWVCSSSPICDPVTKQVLGVIDITGPWKEAQTHTLGMVMMASRVIEQELYEQALLIRHMLLEKYASAVLLYPQNGIIVLDSAFNPIKANLCARGYIRHTTDIELKTLWSAQKFTTDITHQINPVQPQENYEIFIEPLGVSGSVQEIYRGDKRIGFILILSQSEQKVSSGQSHQKETWAKLQSTPWSKIIGKSSQILSSITQCNIVAQSNVPILLLGESGSGKEVFAKSIHEISDRSKGPFVALNCGAIPNELLSSELFGYDPGTFTGAVKGGRKGKFEEAHHGTLFLDEIGEMPLRFQVHLLRVLQEREVVRLGGSTPIPVDVKIIAATHHNLEKLVKDGLFREDFYYRLNVVSITIPSLRERRGDIPLLIDHFLKQFASKYSKPCLKIDRQVRDFLINTYNWPGNVRELQNSIEHAVLFCLECTILMEDFPDYIQRALTHSSPLARNLSSEENWQEFANSNKKAVLISLLKETGGNLSATARQLGIARTTLYRHLEKYGLRQS